MSTLLKSRRLISSLARYVDRIDLPRGKRPEDQPKNPEGFLEQEKHENSPSKQTGSRQKKREPIQKHGISTGKDEIKDGERPDKADYHLRPIYRDLYKEHLRKLAVLAGELATDIENGNLERMRHPAKTDPKAPFGGLDLVRIFHSQNSRLWPFLAQHLDNEFVTPKLTKQIDQTAVHKLVNRILKIESGDRDLAELVRNKLVLLSERGTFEGNCNICRNYFYDSGNKQVHPD
jgi:hypothetical protein